MACANCESRVAARKASSASENRLSRLSGSPPDHRSDQRHIEPPCSDRLPLRRHHRTLEDIETAQFPSIGLVPGYDPACEACDRSIEKLLELLQSCLPPGARHELEPSDHSFHLRPETDFAPELQVSVSVLHPTGTFTESDDNDRTLVDRVLHSLEQLGVQSRVWTQARQ